MINHEAFEAAKSKIVGLSHNENGIGTLSEKTVHGVLKYYYEPDLDYQEVALCGYVADICRDDRIIEIQTGAFGRMRDKLQVFLEQYQVKIVHPIPRIKTITVLNPDTGEILSSRKSPKKGNVYEAFMELYRIKPFLTHPNLSIELVMMDIEEYRVPNTGKRSRKATVKYDRIPKEIVDIITIEDVRDYMMFVPENLPEEFTVKEFAKEAHLMPRYGNLVVGILTHVGVLERVGKQGKAYIYKTNYE